MTNITSETVSLKTPIQEIFDFLSDLNNYNQLLPENNISDFQSTKENCSFKVQNAYNIGLDKVNEKSPNLVTLHSSENSPIKFELNIHISENSGETSTYLNCEADLNPMLKMMVERPLQNLFNYMASRLKEVKG